jgi:hypothetical protein
MCNRFVTVVNKIKHFSVFIECSYAVVSLLRMARSFHHSIPNCDRFYSGRRTTSCWGGNIDRVATTARLLSSLLSCRGLITPQYCTYRKNFTFTDRNTSVSTDFLMAAREKSSKLNLQRKRRALTRRADQTTASGHRWAL